MILKYHASQRPILLVAIETNGRSALFPMLIDTGADRTCFPGYFAALIGHDNLAKDVSVSESHGVGGVSKCYLHSLDLSLIDPEYQLSTDKKWTSPIKKYPFIEKLDSPFGLLGRDIMCYWKQFSMKPTKSKKWVISITL